MRNIVIILFLFGLVLYSQDITNHAAGDNITNISSLSNNIFFTSIESGDIIKVRELISQGADVNGVNGEGWSALHVAVKVNNEAIVKELLLNKRINMNPALPADTVLMDGDSKWYADGQTPLLLAAYYGYADLVSMLLNYGADIMSKDAIDDAMAIHIASARGYYNVVNAILQSSAAKNSSVDIANIGDNTGTTPLMWASMNNQVSVITSLLINKANINLQDDDGWTSLHFAAASDSYRAVEILLKNNADANLDDIEGKKPIDVADDTDIKSLLEKYSVKENTADSLETYN